MKLQSKLIGAFSVLTLITLLVSLLSLWEVNRLGAALYEVGVVRLPSIHGLQMMNNAILDLRESERVMLATTDSTPISAFVERRRLAWRRFDDGWNLYAPLAQTPEENVLWQNLVAEAKTWRQKSDLALASLSHALDQGNMEVVTAERGWFRSESGAAFSKVEGMLTGLIELNHRVAAETNQDSIATYSDLRRIRILMVLASIVSAVSAVTFGLVVGRRISRPIEAVANAFSRIAAGDRTVQLEATSLDEVSQMAQALDQMVKELRSSEGRLRLVSDNLPDTMIYQLMRDPDGKRRFLYVSAGVERIHGISSKQVLDDASLLYSQIVEDDRAAIDAAEEASRHTLTAFQVRARIRRPNGEVRWVHLSSQPRKNPDDSTIWDGLETDVTDRHLAHAERERLAKAIDEHFDAAYWLDHHNRIIYVNAAACTALGYSKDELIGQHLALVSPRATSEAMQIIWQRLRTEGRVSISEAVHRRRDGSEFLVDISVSHVRIHQQEFACGFARDITERKKAEQDLERQLSELKRWRNVTLDRERRVLELKSEVNHLLSRLDLPPRYSSRDTTIIEPGAPKTLTEEGKLQS